VRLFLALPLPPAALARLAGLSGQLAGRRLKVVRPEGLHLTLVFLGEREEAEARAIGELLRAPELRRPPIRACLGGYGQFPPRGWPRVVYVPVREGAREIVELQAGLVGVLRRAGVPLQEEARGFQPHLTLARGGNLRPDLQGLEELLAFEERFVVERLVLFRSLLKPQGAEYQALASLTLQ
jgi:2'-5' RNA ligase